MTGNIKICGSFKGLPFKQECDGALIGVRKINGREYSVNMVDEYGRSFRYGYNLFYLVKRRYYGNKYLLSLFGDNLAYGGLKMV